MCFENVNNFKQIDHFIELCYNYVGETLQLKGEENEYEFSRRVLSKLH